MPIQNKMRLRDLLYWNAIINPRTVVNTSPKAIKKEIQLNAADRSAFGFAPGIVELVWGFESS